MAGDKRASTAVAFVMMIVGLMMMAHGPRAQAQATPTPGSNCTVQLTDLTTCAPYVVPGATHPSPNSDCCTALKGVDDGCLCNTLRIVAQLPASCSLPAVQCANLE
ncbi:Protein M7 [Acorus gramineus]|uniref:Protein M7 n=1 Tax=Acorus gramineus TaxID=55184 RepID=A0AAV9B8Z2_ACOGR|nr:Protein M7 [Acorus gramineus]